VQLPADFPHTRHEQYLVALPDPLLSPAERRASIAVLGRFQRFCEADLARSLAAMARHGFSAQEVELVLNCGVPAAFLSEAD
jgi:hypothetical protein